MEKIDFVIIWVDGNDPEWQKEHQKYSVGANGDKRIVRFRDWNNLKYWFRGVEIFAPWVNKVHFVTCGHYPEWLNLNAPKLHFVKHSDYIPSQYLPTFSSHTIELNIHRIQGLSDKFVYFNDDLFLIDTISSEYFFKNGQPCDMAVLEPVLLRGDSIAHIVLNDVACINNFFEKNRVLKNNVFKWINVKYRKDMLKTLLLLPYPYFPGFLDPHLPNAYLKSTFEDVWKNNYEILDKTCKNKFRDNSDVNQYLFRYWQLAKGEFYPSNTKNGAKYMGIEDENLKDIENMITHQQQKILVINDTDKISSFEKAKMIVIDAFEKILPEKSSFEL